MKITHRASEYLYSRGITDAAIEAYGISGDDEKIIIPVTNKDGKFLFNKYRTYPQKGYFYDRGFEASLFGLQTIDDRWCVLCEGELDAVRLYSEGYPAISGTGGAGTFKEKWITSLPKTVFICYDSDSVGKEAAKKIHWMIPGSRIITLPEDTKDITDFFKTHTKEDFENLLANATTVLKPHQTLKMTSRRSLAVGGAPEGQNEVRISTLLKFDRHKTNCIWHRDPTPSLHYYEKENRVWCFGCSRGGDVIDVAMQVWGVGFLEAKKRLYGF